MEFASEMVINASKAKLKIKEVPITYYANTSRKPHLRSIRDGWRHIRFMLLYSPFHLWVRGKGFLEGYRRGKSGIDFIRGLDLPGAVGKIRFLTLILIGVLGAVAVEMACRPWDVLPEIPAKVAASGLLILFFLGNLAMVLLGQFAGMGYYRWHGTL